MVQVGTQSSLSTQERLPWGGLGVGRMEEQACCGQVGSEIS